MSEEASHYIQRIQACEAAIGRIRAAIRVGDSDTPEVGADWELIRTVAEPRFTHFAYGVRHLAPEAADEALHAMYDRLLDDILSPTFPSLETAFGAYLNHRPIRVLDQITRKYVGPGVSQYIARLDAVRVDGEPLGATLADPHGEAALHAVGEREVLDAAIATLPHIERHVFTLRLAGYTNNAIAEQFTISPATATRIYQQALVHLQQRLRQGEE